jgi:hypothetical protein
MHACMGRAGHARSSLHICIQCNLSFTQCFVRRLFWVLSTLANFRVSLATRPMWSSHIQNGSIGRTRAGRAPFNDATRLDRRVWSVPLIDQTRVIYAFARTQVDGGRVLQHTSQPYMPGTCTDQQQQQPWTSIAGLTEATRPELVHQHR